MSVYTKIDADDLHALLTFYDLGNLTDFTGIAAGIENTNYFVNTSSEQNGGRFVLTIFEALSAYDIPWFLELLDHLAQHNVPVAAPIADQHGRFLNGIASKPCALFQRLQGGHVEQPTNQQCAAIGTALGQLHIASASFTGERDNERGLDWCNTTARALAVDLPMQTSLRIAQELEDQKAVPRAALPRGVIHADLFHDNALFDGEQLAGMIDFYYACSDAYTYDIAVAVNDWCRTSDNRIDTARYDALLAAYQTQRPLTAMEQQHWPMLLRAGALRFWLSRLYDQHHPREGELVHTKDPQVFGELLAWHQANPLSA